MKIKGKIGMRITLQFSILIIIICIILTSISYMNASKALDASIQNTLEHKAKDTAKIFEKEMKRRKVELEILARNESIMSMDWERQKPILEEEKKRLGIERFQVSDLKGITRIPSGKVYSLAQKSNFKLTLKEDKTYIATPLNSEADGKLIMILSTPIKNRNHHTIGVLGSILDAVIFNQIIEKADIGDSGYAFIVDDQGAYVAHKHVDFVKAKQKGIENDKKYNTFRKIKQKMIEGEKGSDECYYDEENKYIGYVPIKGTKWSLGVMLSKQEVMQPIYLLRMKMIEFTMIFIGLGIAIGYFLSRNIKKPLKEIIEFSNELAKGHLNYRVNMNRNDEFEEISNCLNHMANNIGHFMKEVKDASMKVKDCLKSLKDRTEETTYAANEIATSIEDISKKTEIQAIDTQKGDILTNDLAVQIEKVIEATNLMNDRVNQANKLDDKGLETVKELIDKAQESKDITKNICEMILRVDKNAKRVGSITEIIEKISKQTHLLAINASIEAARAGTYGRGFSVVAQEVSRLADESSCATKEVKEMIQQIQKQFEILIQGIQKVNETVKNQDVSVNRTKDIFADISHTIKLLEQKSQDIQKTSSEMAKQKNDIIETIDHITVVSQETSAGAQQVCASTQVQLEAMEQVVVHDQALKELVENLQNHIQRFKL